MSGNGCRLCWWYERRWPSVENFSKSCVKKDLTGRADILQMPISGGSGLSPVIAESFALSIFQPAHGCRPSSRIPWSGKVPRYRRGPHHRNWPSVFCEIQLDFVYTAHEGTAFAGFVYSPNFQHRMAFFQQFFISNSSIFYSFVSPLSKIVDLHKSLWLLQLPIFPVTPVNH